VASFIYYGNVCFSEIVHYVA